MMLRKAKLIFLIVMHWSAHAFRLYTLWSSIYRFIYHRKYKHVVLSLGLDPDQATALMDTLTWKKDGLKELGDAVGSPYWVQHCIDSIAETGSQPDGSLDCDDFSAWAVNCINPNFEPLYFTTSWLTLEGKPSGHAVCLFFRGRNPKKLYHTGNWGIRGPFKSLPELSKKMIAAAGGHEPIGWSLYTYDMELIDFGKGIPPEYNLIDRP